MPQAHTIMDLRKVTKPMDPPPQPHLEVVLGPSSVEVLPKQIKTGDRVLIIGDQGRCILKTEEGLQQLRHCEQCGYMVLETDIIWARQPNRLGECGEVLCCRFCHKED